MPVRGDLAPVPQDARSLRTLLVAGNSYARAEGGPVTAGATSGRFRYSLAVADRLGAQEHNLANNGAIHHRPEKAAAGDGGFASILQRYIPSRSSAPYLADIEAAILSTGVNDLGTLGIASMAPWQEAVRNTLCRLRSGSNFEDTDASIVYGGTWTNSGSTVANSGGQTKNTTAVGATATISVPSDFPGGEVAIGFTLANGFVTNASITVDGVDTGNPLAYATGFVPVASTYSGTVRRITGLSPGAHTIVVTSTTGSTLLALDWWAVIAETPPLIAFPLMPRIPAGSPSDADITSLNGLIKGLCNEFTDGRVFPVDFDSLINKNSAYFNAAGDHPNDRGHQRMAALMTKEFRSRFWMLDPMAPAAVPEQWHYVNNKTEPQFAGTWINAGVAGYPDASFRRESDGTVILRGLIKSGTAATTAFTLPEPFRPDKTVLHPLVINNGAGAVINLITINTDGTVVPAASGTTWTDLEGVSFKAA